MNRLLIIIVKTFDNMIGFSIKKHIATSWGTSRKCDCERAKQVQILSSIKSFNKGNKKLQKKRYY